ncbi:hypothetical protein F1C16_08000 [Hymenobacter sp. NBH84]|uniref:hypothetical protein n=1 Tax=Hymenobacter sp. NBH84 TaxID=2596915 RepID=UPI0016255D25|nr:hypothetical protein [Hymenobacter sp. NBH84]QNE39498.1 hypothetical protein F1C16_08000 [Hymenobacter sp. NBH84]
MKRNWAYWIGQQRWLSLRDMEAYAVPTAGPNWRLLFDCAVSVGRIEVLSAFDGRRRYYDSFYLAQQQAAAGDVITFGGGEFGSTTDDVLFEKSLHVRLSCTTVWTVRNAYVHTGSYAARTVTIEGGTLKELVNWYGPIDGATLVLRNLRHEGNIIHNGFQNASQLGLYAYVLNNVQAYAPANTIYFESRARNI